MSAIGRAITLSVYDLSRKKLCDLYDSNSPNRFHAYDIKLNQGMSDSKELSFSLLKHVDGEMNPNWDFVQAEFLLRYTNDGYTDWYIINVPTVSRKGNTAEMSVSCSHRSDILKTKNLYIEFDDANGIGTIEELVSASLAGSGWSIGECDTFYEDDGTTEKVRSYSSSSKVGALKNIDGICEIFFAYPVYHGDTQTVDIRSLNNRDGFLELQYGKNTDALSRKSDSTNIVTRLFVEGEYGEDGYIGIDSVNPTGQSFIVNFDYYKDLGLFTNDHQEALDDYMSAVSSLKTAIESAYADVESKKSQLNLL